MSNIQFEIILNEYKSKDCEIYWHPKYLMEDETLGKEYKHEWRSYLARKNMDQISTSLTNDKRILRFSFYSKIVARKIFNICRVLKQPPEVRYLALDILDRFMILHFFSVAQTIEEKEKLTQKVWRIITNRIIRQSFLRILSCIQLASKYCSSYKAVSTIEIQKIMRFFTKKYYSSPCDLIKSEARVLQTLNFNIPTVTPLTYIEMFFEDFHEEYVEKHLKLSLYSFLNICIDVLDISMIFHKEIYHTLYARVIGKTLKIKDVQFLGIEADYMYLATSVIHTAATLQDPSNVIPRKFLDFFCATTRYNAEEIEILGNLILEIILKNKLSKAKK